MSLNACVWKKNMWKENEMSKNKGKKKYTRLFFHCDFFYGDCLELRMNLG